ncbi:MAG: metalloregulator ArsR/SmtB family transcription factor [Candidatus Bipolaricaulota bacterium]
MQYCNELQLPVTLIDVGKALSHPVRLRMLELLAHGECCGCEIAPQVGLDPSVVSRHLALLARGGLVRSRRDGARLMWSLASEEIAALLDRLGSCSEEGRR